MEVSKTNRLFIIGDSFATPSNDGSFYGKILREEFPEIEVSWGGQGSRDVQSIIDDWIKLLPHLTENDYLIVAIPVFFRTRLPLSEDNWGDIGLTGMNLIKRFVGTQSYKEGTDLEFFGRTFNGSYLESITNNQSIINSTKASEINFFEVIDALRKITKAKNYAFSWAEFERPPKPFDDYAELKRKIGIWRTMRDDFLEFGSKYINAEHDRHWQNDTHKAFANMIIKEFKIKKIDLI
jgi:hypothetical protein